MKIYPKPERSSRKGKKKYLGFQIFKNRSKRANIFSKNRATTKSMMEYTIDDDDALTSDDDSDVNEEEEEEEQLLQQQPNADREERVHNIDNVLNNNDVERNPRRHNGNQRDVRKWKKMRGRGDLGVGASSRNNNNNNNNVVCQPVIDATQQVRGVNCGSIGPELEKLRREQGENREYYTKEHFDRLYGRVKPWNRDQRANKVWCKDIHPAGVTCNECTSCHFCRQKSCDVKTTCQCATWAKAPEGGRGRGSWCGWCLEMRMGENIEEAIADDEWRCPVCRDICNCSGANCLRHKRHLFPTQQLTREAEQYGWQSVAHYLITTALVTGKDAPPMLDLPAAYVKRRQPKGAVNGSGNTKFSSGKNNNGERASGKNKEEMQREREAAALRREIEMKVRMAFGAVNEEEEEEEDGDMLNAGDVEDGGDGRSKARRQKPPKRTSDTIDASTRREGGGEEEEDADMDEQDAILGGDGTTFDEQQRQQQTVKPKKTATITTMFKRFADKNSGAFLFAASSDDESELDSSDGEFDDELLAQQQRERRERNELDLKNRVLGGKEVDTGGAAEGAHIRGKEAGNNDDDDDIIMYDGEREKKTFKSTSFQRNADDEMIGRELEPSRQLRDAQFNDETSEEMEFFQRRRERRKRRRAIQSVARARHINATTGGFAPSRSAGPGGVNINRPGQMHPASAPESSLLQPPAEPAQQGEVNQQQPPASTTTTTTTTIFPSSTEDIPSEEVLSAEAAVSEMRREDETQAERADAQEVEEERRVLDAAAASTSGEVVQILREFIELTSPSNETFQKRNIEEASFELFNEKIVSSLERAEALLFASEESELRAFYALCLRANKYAPYLKHKKVSSLRIREKIIDLINNVEKFQSFDVSQRATCLRASLRLIERYWSGKDLDVFKVSDEEEDHTFDGMEVITDEDGNTVRGERTTSEFMRARANHALESCLRLVSICSNEFALARERENWVASRKLLNPSLMDASDLIAPAVSEGCQKRIDDATARIMEEYEVQKARRNESVIVGLSDSSQENDDDPAAQLQPPAVADETVHLQKRETDIALATTKILIETTESTHILILAALSVLRVVAKGLAFTPSHGAFLRSKMLSNTIGSFVSPKLPFRPKIRKCALGLISVCVSRGERDWLESRSEENKIVADASAKFCWPHIADLLRENEDDYENVETMNDKSGGYSSAVNRAATETAARTLNLLVKSGVWPWGKAELAISHPFAPKDFWKLANPRKRAKAFRLYARLVDSTPVLRGGIGAPLLKLWALCAMDVAASEKGERRQQNALLRANGLHRARARLARACARHPRLFDAFSSSTMLKREAMDARNTAGVLKRSSWVVESLVRCCEVGGNPVATVAAINALQEVYDKRVQECSGRASGNKSRAFRIGFKAIMSAAYSRNTDLKLFGVEQRIQALRMALDTFMSILFEESDALQVDTILEGLINSAKSLAIFFSLDSIACCSLLKQLCYACVERKYAKKATREKFSRGFFASLYDASYIVDNNLDIRNSRECMRSAVLLGVLGSCVGSARSLATVPSANIACENWVLAFETAMERSSNSEDQFDDANFLFAASEDSSLLGQMCVNFLEANLPPVCAIGRGAAPPPIAVADAKIRSVCLNALILLFENKKAPLHFKTKRDYQNAPTWVKYFTKACLKICAGEIAACLGGCKDFSQSRARDVVATPMTKAQAMEFRQKILQSISGNHAQSYRVLEEASRSFRKPSEHFYVSKENGLEEERVPHPSVCAMRFLIRFSKISKFCAMEIASKVVPVIEGAFKYGDTFSKRHMDGPLHELRYAIEGMMKQNGEDNDEVADEERKRPFHPQGDEENAENVDPHSKKVKTEPVEIKEEEQEVKIERTAPWFERCDRNVLYSSTRTDFATIASRASDAQPFTIVGKLCSREPKVGVSSKTNPKTNRTFEMLFVTLENEKGLKVRAQMVGKSARVLADALDELKKRDFELVRIDGVLPQKKAELKPGLTAMVWDPKGASNVYVSSFD